MIRRHHICILLWLFFSITLQGQDKERLRTPDTFYSDRITDQDGTPLSGIQIRVKGKGLSTITDVNGEFSINAQNGDIIILSKNGQIINSYRLDGSVYYEIEDQSEQIGAEKKERTLTKSRKIKADNSSLFFSFLDSARSLQKSNPTKSIDYIESSLKIANQTKNKSQIAASYNVLGDVYMNLKQYDLAVSNYAITLDYANNKLNQLKYARALLLNADYEKSQVQYESILKNQNITTNEKVMIYEGLGDIYSKQQQYSTAFNQYQTALTLAKRVNDAAKISVLNSKISSALEAQGDTDKAESYLLKNSSQVQQSPKKAIIESKRAADFYSRNKNVDKEVIHSTTRSTQKFRSYRIRCRCCRR